MTQYGLPYKGSKNKIAEWIVENLPPAKNFYDLFGGGAAITHCASTSGKYENVIYNDLDTRTYEYVKGTLAGKYHDRTEWISREEFHKRKNEDGFIAYVWSFGNNGFDYLYGKPIEKQKEALHCAVVDNDFTMCKQMGIELELTGKTLHERRLQAGRLQHLERLQHLQYMEHLDRIEFYNMSYDQIKIQPDSVVYCDIPYKGTDKYKEMIDYDKFYEWACKQSVPVYVSEYNIEHPRFEIVAQKEKRSTLCTTNRNVRNIERLYKVR